MRNICFSLILSLCCLAGSRAATVTGFVINAGTGNPEVNTVVTITDSSATFTILDTTDAVGQFVTTLPAGLALGTLVKVSTYADSSIAVSNYHFNGNNITTNLFVGNWRGTSTLHGEVLLQATAVPNNGPTRVYFIRKAYDPVLMDTTLTLFDSMMTNAAGGFCKTFATVPAGTILIKAALLPSHPGYASYLPTYSLGVISWNNAWNISPAGVTSYSNYLFSMVAGTNPGGPGFIGGSVLLGANKSTGVGDPLAHRILLLTNSAGQAVAYTYSDAAGKFQLPSVPYGTYKLFGDALGKTNPPLTVTVSATQKTVTNIIFEENDETFKGRFGTLAVSTATGIEALAIFPNPAKDELGFTGLDNIKGDKTILISDLRGAAVARHHITSGNAGHISIASLVPGTYIVTVQTEKGSAAFKIIR